MITSQELDLRISESAKRVKEAKEKYEEDSKLYGDHLALLEYTSGIVEEKIEEVRDKTEPIINEALKVIFSEDKYTFEFHSKVLRERAVYVPLIKHGGIEGTTDSFGGGVNIIVSLLLRLLFIVMAEAPKMLILDESLNQLSPKYRERTAKFLKTFCKELDFTILLINFDENDDYSEVADISYEAYRYGSSETRFKTCKA